MAGRRRNQVYQGRAANENRAVSIAGHHQPRSRQPQRMPLDRHGEYHRRQHLRQATEQQRMAGVKAAAQDLADTGDQQINRNRIAKDASSVQA